VSVILAGSYVLSGWFLRFSLFLAAYSNTSDGSVTSSAGWANWRNLASDEVQARRYQTRKPGSVPLSDGSLLLLR
jgi:hypothetical protein